MEGVISNADHGTEAVAAGGRLLLLFAAAAAAATAHPAGGRGNVDGMYEHITSAGVPKGS
jgi:hypothetical protein